ncbi:MAG: YihY/virulence factor BrkB family protein [Rhodothermales bacterium]
MPAFNPEDLLDVAKYYASGVYRELREKPVFLWAQAIGYKVLITIAPLLLLATGIVGQILRNDRPFSFVESAIRSVFPAYQSEELISFLSQLQNVSGRLTLVGLIGLLLAAVTLFTTLRIALSGVFQEDWHGTRSLFRGYAFDLRMALQVGLLFTASIGLTVVAQTINTNLFWGLTELGFETQWLQSGWLTVLNVFGLLLPWLISIAMFFLLIYMTPVPRPPLRSAFLGATVASLLWELAKFGFSAYAKSMGSFETSGLAALGDTFVLVVILVFWAYFSGLIMIIGAIMCMLHERRRRFLALEPDE